MTEKLYYADPYLTTFSAAVTGCTPKDGAWLVTLDRTAFYPEGGGQPGDTGALCRAGEEIRVLDTHERDGTVLHTCAAPLEPGAQVTGTIDWEPRFDRMQQHSGEHVLSGFLHSMYGLENVGFHMGADAVTIDTSAPVTAEQLAAAEEAANRYILGDHPVEITHPSPEELAALPYRSKKELSGDVRIVTFPGADCCACCGTHVRRTGEIGLVKILSAVKFRTGLRLEILSGLRAFRRLGELTAQNAEISRLLSAKPGETAAAVSRLLEAHAAEKARAGALEEQLIGLRAAAYAGAGDSLIFAEELSPDAARRLADGVAEVCGGLALVLYGGEGSWRYAAAMRDVELLPFAKTLNGALQGRGGGRGGLVQGSLAAGRSEIERFWAAHATPAKNEQ